MVDRFCITPVGVEVVVVVVVSDEGGGVSTGGATVPYSVVVVVSFVAVGPHPAHANAAADMIRNNLSCDISVFSQ